MKLSKKTFRELGKLSFNFSLLITGTVVISPLVKGSTNKIMVAGGILIALILLLMGIILMERGSEDEL